MTPLIWLLASANASPSMDSIYLVMVDRFANGRTDNDVEIDITDTQAFHGGDLSGITANIDYIEALGVDTVWLTPITKMRTAPINEHGAFHGYWLENGRKVEPRFGSLAELKALREALRVRGIKLILDVVLNHVGPDTPLVSMQPDWFHAKGDITDWSDVTQLQTHDVHGLPDLNQTLPSVTQHLTRDGQHWLKQVSPAGFRIDAVRHLDPVFLKTWTDQLSKNAAEPLIFAGEIFDGNPVNIANTVKKSGLTHSFDFPLHYAIIESMCAGGDLRKIATVLTQDRRFAPDHQHITFLDNHDTARMTTACGEQTRPALTLLTSLRGIPAITWGSGAALEGATASEARADMIFEPTPLREWIVDRLDDRRSYTPLISGQTDVLLASESRLVVARVLRDEAIVISVGESPAKPVLPAEAGAVHWIPIAGEHVRRWLITPKDASGFQAWVEKLTTDEAQTIDITIEAGSADYISGSDPVLGAWSESAALGPGSQTVALPVGGHVAVKTFQRAEDGTVTWSSESDHFIDVDASATTGDPIKLGR